MSTMNLSKLSDEQIASTMPGALPDKPAALDRLLDDVQTSPRLAILQASLKKKEAELDRRFDNHFADVKSANGQPLNDKRNGSATMERWDRQDDAIRSMKASIERTKRAIEIEQDKIANVASVDLPAPIRDLLATGELAQWRKHPNTFFVRGVDKSRIVFNQSTGDIGIRYLSDCKPDQYPLLRDCFKKLNAALAEPAAISLDDQGDKLATLERDDRFAME